MATLAGNTIASTYPLLLKIDSSGIDGTLRAIQDGDATDSAVKISTGAMSVDGNVTITTTDNSDNIALVSTDADANAAPNLSFWRNSSSPADNDLLGQINWYAENDADEKTHMAQFYVTSMDVSDGSEDVRFVIQTILGGATETSRIELLPSETVINQDSKDIDFRVESDGGANMLFVDAGNDKVGINTNSPDNLFHIEFADGSDTTAANIASDNVTGIQLTNTTNSNGNGTMLLMESNNGSNQTAIGHIQDDATSAHMAFYTELSGTFSEKMRLLHNGNLAIGTDSPNTVLHLKFTDDTTNAADNSSLTHSSGIYINNESTTNEAHSSVGFRTNNLDGALSMIYGGSANEGRMSVNMEGAERLSVTHDGKVFIGSTSSRALSGVNAQLQVEGTTYSTSSAHLIGNTGTDASTAPILFFGRSRGTSDGSSTSVASGDRLGALFFCGADGTDINTPAATIQVSVDETPGSNDMPGRIEFRTTADGASSTTERMRITSRGDVGIGDTAPGTALTNFGSASRGLSIKNVQPTIALTDTDTGSGHFWIANAGGISYFQNNVSGATYRFYVESTIALEIENDGVLKSSDGIEFEGSALGGSQTGVSSSGSGGDLLLFANGSAHARLQSNGRFVIGTTSGNAKLHMHETTDGQELIFLNHSVTGANQTYIQFRHDGTQRGNIQVNDSNDQIVYNTSVSDKRLKKDFEDWDESILPAFKSLKPQLFNFKNSENKSGKSKGYIAQDNVDNFPEAYTTSKFLDDDDTEYYSFNPSGMVAYLMKAVQELTAKVEALENA